MLRLALALCAAVLLAGCWPLAFFASSGDAYRGYARSGGMYVAHRDVNTTCLTPRLRLALADFEGHFGRKIVMSSGYRDPFHNGKVGGAENSYHMRCMAADFFIPGVPKQRLVAFAARHPLVGGLGCYPGREFIHVDVRDRPRGHGGPVTFNC